MATAVRQLFHSPVGPVPDVFTLQHPVITSLLWGCLLMAIFVPLSIRRYQRMGR
jgi:ABC-2 type transport system permease protein